MDSIVLEVSPNKCAPNFFPPSAAAEPLWCTVLTVYSPRVPDISIRYIVITACIVALSYLLSIVIPDISFVFGIIGATAGTHSSCFLQL